METILEYSEVHSSHQASPLPSIPPRGPSDDMTRTSSNDWMSRARPPNGGIPFYTAPHIYIYTHVQYNIYIIMNQYVSPQRHHTLEIKLVGWKTLNPRSLVISRAYVGIKGE
jgi:hypothetical protein